MEQYRQYGTVERPQVWLPGNSGSTMCLMSDLDRSPNLSGHCVFTCKVMKMMMENTNTYQAFAVHRSVLSA